MQRLFDTKARIVLTVVSLLIGAIAGGLWLANVSNPEVQSSEDGFEAFGPGISFFFTVSAFVVDGIVQDVDAEQVTISEISLLYESDLTRDRLPQSEWPSTDVDVVLGPGFDAGAVEVNDRIVAMVFDRAAGDLGPWRANVVGRVFDDGSVAMLNDPGSMQLELEAVADTLGVSQVEAFAAIARDLRDMWEDSQRVGELPEDIGQAAAVIRDFEIPDTSDGDWHGTDPRLRYYSDAPRSVLDRLVRLPVRWVIDPAVAGGSDEVLLSLHDGQAGGKTLLASLTSSGGFALVEPGRDIEVLIATWDDPVGEVVGIIPASEWESSGELEITVSVEGDSVVARFNAASAG